jgi:hypothetical protein
MRLWVYVWQHQSSAHQKSNIYLMKCFGDFDINDLTFENILSEISILCQCIANFR